MKTIKDIFPVAPGGYVVVFNDHTAWYQRAYPETPAQSQLDAHEETIWALCRLVLDLQSANKP